MRSSKLLFLVMLALGACNAYTSDSSYYPPTPPAPSKGAALVQITVPTAAPMVAHGETRSAIAVVTDSSGEFMNAPVIKWTSSDTTVAIVTGTSAVGTIIAIDDGTANIIATIGGVHQSVPVTVHRTVASVVVFSDIDVFGPGETVQLSAFARDPRGATMQRVHNFTFSTQSPGKVIVSPAGLVTGIITTPVVRVAATATYEGFDVSGFLNLVVFAPATFDFAAQMLGGGIPVPVQSQGEGLSFYRLNGQRINYLTTWSNISGPATHIQILGPGPAGQASHVLVELPLPVQTKNWGVLNAFFTAADIRGQAGRPAISLDSVTVLLRRGQAFVNVETAAHPDGELRGPIEGPFRQN